MLGLAIFGLVAVPTHHVASAAEGSYSGFVLDFEPGAYPAVTVVDDDPGVLSGSGSETRAAVGGGGWSFQFNTFSDPMEARVYDTDELLPGGAQPRFEIDRLGVNGCVTSGFVDVLQPATALPDQTLVSFAADFDVKCVSNPGSGRLRGSIRFNSTIATRLLHITPVGSFPDAVLGSTSGLAITVSGMGRGPIDVGGLSISGNDPADFSVDAGDCGGASIANGQTCTLQATFAPTTTTDRSAELSIGSSEFGLPRTVNLSGYGKSPLTLLPIQFLSWSDAGDWVGKGSVTFLRPAPFSQYGGQVDGAALSGGGWTLRFYPPDGSSMVAGHYQTPEAFLNVDGNGAGCNFTVGAFDVIDPPIYDSDGTLLQFSANFTQHCEGAVPALYGAIRYHSSAPLPDNTPPTGTIAINGGAAYTSSTAATLSVPAVDDLLAVEDVALSNDGVTWTTRQFARAQPWTLPATNGMRTVWARWADSNGNWSAPVSDSIILDTELPTTSAVASTVAAPSSIWNGWVQTTVNWHGTDAVSGVARYEIEQSTDGGSYVRLGSYLTHPSMDLWLAPWHTYRVRVRAVDRAGNIGAWAYGPSSRIVPYQETNPGITWSGSWTTAPGTGYWGGAERVTTSAGASASLTFTGRSIAWVTAVGPNRGQAKVYVDGTFVGTIDLHAASGLPRRVMFSRAWGQSGVHSLKIVAVATAGRPQVDLDGFIVGS